MFNRQPLAPADQLGSVSLRCRTPLARTRLPKPVIARRWRMLVAESRGAEDEPPPPGGRDNRLARLEAILFLAREPLNSRKLAQYANLADGTQARTLVRRLNELYDQGARAFRVEEVAGGFQLMTRLKFAAWLRRLEHVPGETRLSAPALETLAVVAYRQPVLRADIEAIRGVSCGEILRQLMERDLVRISGRSEELGRPYLYATTKRFLETFGLRNLDELPRAELFRPSAAEEPLATDPPQPGSPPLQQEESEVSATQPSGTKLERPWLEQQPLQAAPNPQVALEEDDDLDDFDDFDDDDDKDDADELEEDDDLEEDEWEEVEDDDFDDDDDWDDDDDLDWDDDEDLDEDEDEDWV